MKKPSRLRALFCAIAALSALYVGAVIYVLHFQTSRLLFPKTNASEFHAANTVRITEVSGNEMLVRRYGDDRNGCVIFFPGQHGNLPEYERQLFARFTAAGISVFAIAYPGQDGAAGRSELAETRVLTSRVVGMVAESCKLTRTVFVGRSLGSMLAAYAAVGSRPAGVLLESTAPSLSSAIETRLRSNFLLRPLTHLPISALLPHDYSLNEALASTPAVPVVIFQGTEDEVTPISALRDVHKIGGRITLIPVPSGTHSDTYILAGNAYVDTVRSMLDAGRR